MTRSSARSSGSGLLALLLASALCQEASSVLSAANLAGLTLEETRVYAGYEAGRENNLKA